jgi:hypothetical protein
VYYQIKINFILSNSLFYVSLKSAFSMKKQFTPRILSFISGIVFSSALFSQWNPNTAINTPVCTANSSQIDLRMTDDDQGGFFIVWKDYRNGSPDIFAQHFDATGTALWTPNGVPVCTNPSDQSTPGLISDMNGGIIVSWSDWRSGIERDLYAQRIGPSGTPLWTMDGVVVTNQQEREHNERLVSDQLGGAYVVFEKQVSGQWRIWAQRIDASGNTLWAPGGMAVSTVNSNFLNERIQEDGKGGVIVTWQDLRNGADYDVYAQRITPAGVRKWGTGGVKLCGSAQDQTNPKIDPDSSTGGCYVAWADNRNGTSTSHNYDIYAQRVDSSGNLLWGTNGVAVCTSPGNQTAVDLLSNPKVSGLIITWKDYRSGTNNDIYAQKLNPSGVVQWIVNGNPICTTTADQLNPNITGDGTGGAVIVWQDGVPGSYDIKAQRVSTNGAAQWAANGVAVSNAAGAQTSPKNISDGSGGSIFAWEDSRTGTIDIYCHHIYWDGFNIGIDEENFLASVSCFPNPFTNEVNLTYSLVKKEKIVIKILDALGKEIAQVVSEDQQQLSGPTTVVINTEKLGIKAGVYFIQMNGTSFSKVLKLIKSE